MQRFKEPTRNSAFISTILLTFILHRKMTRMASEICLVFCTASSLTVSESDRKSMFLTFLRRCGCNAASLRRIWILIRQTAQVSTRYRGETWSAKPWQKRLGRPSTHCGTACRVRKDRLGHSQQDRRHVRQPCIPGCRFLSFVADLGEYYSSNTVSWTFVCSPCAVKLRYCSSEMHRP